MARHHLTLMFVVTAGIALTLSVVFWFSGAMTIATISAAALIPIGVLYVLMLSIGLQEADDPEESQPEDLSEFEKRHVHRSDVHTES